MFARGKNHPSTVRHRPVNFICKKAVIFLYSIFTASDLEKKGFYLLPIVNLLDSYKVYHQVDPRLWKSLVNLASLVLFWGFLRQSARPGTRARSSWHSCALVRALVRSHTPPVRPSCIHPPLLHLSPSLSIRSGTTFSNVSFPPFSPGNLLHVFWTLFSVFCCFCLLFPSPAPRFY